MIEALNMHLDIVRTVIKNDVNEVSVCVDRKRDTGVFYTLISIYSVEVRKKLAQMIAADDLLNTSNDFVGSFTLRDTMHLVFAYHKENRLCDREAIYAPTFADRKKLALWFLVACAETELRDALGELLLEDRNINLAPDGKVYFNYFFDFKGADLDNDRFYQKVAQYAFQILSREYAVKYEGQIMDYPSELQVFSKKVQNNSFQSFNQVLTFVKMLPDKPTERSRGLRRIWDKLVQFWHYIRSNSSRLFLATVVVVTLCYLGYQITMRIAVRSRTKASTTYSGMEQIGEVYLGNKEL